MWFRGADREQALFRITTEGLPPLKEPNKWSSDFKDFLKQATTQDPSLRPSASELLQHPFVKNVPQSSGELFKIVKKCKMNRQVALDQALAGL